MTTPTPLGSVLARAREANGWSLREAEARTGVSNAHISQIETGAIREPSLVVLAGLAGGYGLELRSLLSLADSRVIAALESVISAERERAARIVSGHQIASVTTAEYPSGLFPAVVSGVTVSCSCGERFPASSPPDRPAAALAAHVAALIRDGEA